MTMWQGAVLFVGWWCPAIAASAVIKYQSPAGFCASALHAYTVPLLRDARDPTHPATCACWLRLLLAAADYPLDKATTPDGGSMHDTFQFGANAVRMVADPGYGGWPWAEATADLCASTSQLFAAVLPPSEGALENNPKDTSPEHPAKLPGMVQAAQRMSNLSKSCPVVRGIIIDDFCQHADPENPHQLCHKVSPTGMADIKAALLGKPVDPATGKVDHTGAATTPHLELWVIYYAQQLHLNYSIAADQLELIDGISLWQNQEPQTGTLQGTQQMLTLAAARFPQQRLQSGTVLAFSTFGTAPAQRVRDVLTASLLALRRGTIENALLLDAKDLEQGIVNRSQWDALSIPSLLEEELWPYMGEGKIELAPSTVEAVVSIQRLLAVDSNGEGWVTRKRTNSSGMMTFASFSGLHQVTVELPDGTKRDAHITLVAQQTTTVTVDVSSYKRPTYLTEGETDSPTVPTDGMVIMHSCSLKAGTYHLPNGITIGASNAHIDMTGVTLIGTGNGTGFGVTMIGVQDVSVVGGNVHGYFYGLRIEHCHGCAVHSLDASRNWADPNALTAKAPWLDINAPPDLDDRVNLGGGAFVLRCTGLVLQGLTANDQGNGLDIYHSIGITASNCNASNNTGWGVHLHNTSHSTVEHGRFNDCVRHGLGDSAGILLVNNSNLNVIDDNTCLRGGDGFFIGNENGSPSNFNTVTNNDCSHAAANAFECTFSNGNRFENNRASYSSYGFWLGFSYNSTVRGNTMIGCGSGIEIDHGQDNTLAENTITNSNGPGIVLQTDGSAPFASRPWLHLPAETMSTRTIVSSNRFGDNNNYHIELRK